MVGFIIGHFLATKYLVFIIVHELIKIKKSNVIGISIRMNHKKEKSNRLITSGVVPNDAVKSLVFYICPEKKCGLTVRLVAVPCPGEHPAGVLPPAGPV